MNGSVFLTGENQMQLRWYSLKMIPVNVPSGKWYGALEVLAPCKIVPEALLADHIACSC